MSGAPQVSLASRLQKTMSDTSHTPEDIKIVARTFAAHPLQSFFDVQRRTDIVYDRLEYVQILAYFWARFSCF